MIVGASLFTFITPQNNVSAASCVDTTKNGSVKISWKSTSTVQVSTNGPACNDDTLWLSSFKLPVAYNSDNSGWFGTDPNGVKHPTSYPQTAFKHVRITIKAGQVLNQTASVSLPNLCETAAQVDLYHRKDALSSVKTDGGVYENGDVNYASGFVVKYQPELCKTKETPTPKPLPKPDPILDPLPVMPAAQTVATPTKETVAELPQTGAARTLILMFGGGAAAAIITEAIIRFRNR